MLIDTRERTLDPAPAERPLELVWRFLAGLFTVIGVCAAAALLGR